MAKGNRNIKENLKIIEKAIQKGINFHNRDAILKYGPPAELIKRVHESIPKEGRDLSELLDYFEREIMPFCVAQCNPRYLAFPDSGNSLLAIVADILKSFTNQNLIADAKSAPIATYMEIQVLQWLRELIGFKDNNEFPKNISEVGGMFCAGGVLSNITAMLAARSTLLKDSFKKGIDSKNVYTLSPEEIGHYSIESAMGYLGFGTDKLVKVKLNKDFSMNLVDLESKIKKIISKKGKILCVVAYAGDSRTMKVDNLKKIYDLCKKYKVWMHVDACHGSQLLFSKLNKKDLEGIKLADSITLDPHKVLMVPYPCSVVLFKNPKVLLNLARNFDMTILPETYDLGQITPFVGSRAFDSLKLWFLLKAMGLRNIEKIIDNRIKLTKYASRYMRDCSEIKIFNEVNINSICFIFFPKNLQVNYKLANKEERAKIGKSLDLINKEIHDRIYKQGSFCIHTFKLSDVGNRAFLKDSGTRQVLGIIIGNPLTTKRDIKLVINEIIKVGSNIYKKQILKIEHE